LSAVHASPSNWWSISSPRAWSHDQILTSYPHLTEEYIRACLNYASELLREEKVYPLKIA